MRTVTPPSATAPHESKRRLLDAALSVVRAKGYSATRVEDVCEAAGLTKGSFFHHFHSKEQLALEAAQHFADRADALFAAAPYQLLEDPLSRVYGYLDFRIAILRGPLNEFTCYLGTLVQETYESHPAIRAACDTHLRSHADMLAKDIALARRLHAPRASWSAEGMALHIQAVIQGAFILAKASGNPKIAADSLRHLRRYLETQFTAHTQETP